MREYGILHVDLPGKNDSIANRRIRPVHAFALRPPVSRQTISFVLIMLFASQPSLFQTVPDYRVLNHH